MAFRQRTAFGLALLAAAGVSPSALGQTLTLTNDQYGVQRDPRHDDELDADQINKADCLNDEIIEFHVGVTGVVNDTLDFQIWRGTGCNDRMTRFESSSNCVQIEVNEDRNENSLNVDVGVRQIMAAGTTSGSDGGTGGTSGTGGTAGSGGTEGGTAGGGAAGSSGSGGTAGAGGTGATGAAPGVGTDIGVEVCNGDPNFPSATQFTLHFILVDGNGEAPTGTTYSPAIWTATHDVVPPDPPGNVTAGVGESALVLNWAIEDDRGDIDHFNAYCDPPPSAVIEDGAGGASDGPIGDCNSSLDMGDAPDPQYYCGESDSYSASMQTDPLQNNVNYTVAVASVDIFKNEGVLSQTTCQAPQLVRDFYEAYRQAGGKGGGGFCAIGAERSSGFALLVAAMGLAFLARRRAAGSRKGMS